MRTPKKHEETPRGLTDISMKGVERLLKNNNNFSQSEEAGPSSSHYTSFPKGKSSDATEFEWEDGFISTPGSREVVVQFYDDSPSTSKKKTVPRPTVQDKEVAELVHKVHLLCLIARGRLIDNACDDSLIQAALLSLIPSYLLKRADEPKLTANALTPLIKWFHDNFKVDCSGRPEKPFELCLASALENRKGSAEEVAALSVALFRALKLTTRFVSILDVASLKPITDTSGCSSEDLTRVDSGLFDSSTPMVTTPRKVSVSPLQSPSHKLSLNEKNSCGRGANEERLNTIASKECNDSSEACRTKSDGSKRKGDLEFELQLEMAAFATAYGLHDKSSSQMTDWSSSSTQLSSPSNIFKRIKTEKVPVQSQGISTAVGSRKRGAPLYWAEVFCGGENLTGKWVHVDAVNSIIGGEETVEAATSACKRTLRYVVAFAGNGAKDVTRRYCTKWYKIASQRINPHWWDAVLGPLRELESRATGGLVLMDDRQLFTSSEPEMVNPSSSSVKAVLNDSVNTRIQERSRFATRSSLEDMELQTRALTEPLPTNQQAYRNHHLYCIERWLTKYEMLRPKGPILGYCSGHPVYPRTCVQILQTKQRWLREGLQIKANESPAKVMKRSVKLSKGENSELGVSKEDEARGSFVLYGKWQTEPLDLPRATNGRVPKNERGQVDVWSEKCLPLGTVHLRLPRVVPVAKRLEIDFAPAMVGFEFRNGRSVPVYEGIVVCSEFNDAIIQAYAEEEEKREAEEKRRDEAQAISRWYQLLSSVITRQRLRDAYGDDSTSEIPRHLNRKESACGMQVTNCEGNNPEGPRGHAFKSESTAVTEDHEHIFPVEDQTFDEESSVRTKRCPCGFLVQVEEL